MLSIFTGNFSFGSLQKYRSNTIVDFIESAVEHSRSGQFLFFLHRHSNGNLMEPVLPVRVQLLNPISRFRQVQSLQHNCRYEFRFFNRKKFNSTFSFGII